jgi:DNA replication factor GINS
MSTAEAQNRGEMDAEGDISDHLALKDVYKLLKKEIETPSLQAIEPDTFQKIAAALGNLKGQGYEGVEAKIRDRMAELLANSAKLLIEARQAKIRSGGGEPLDYSKLTDEEKYVLDGRRESESRLSEVVAATVKGRPKVLESISARMRSKQIVVRFLRATEAFVGVDMNKYGPFQQEDIASLPFENARSIIEGGAAVEVHVE